MYGRTCKSACLPTDLFIMNLNKIFSKQPPFVHKKLSPTKKSLTSAKFGIIFWMTSWCYSSLNRQKTVKYANKFQGDVLLWVIFNSIELPQSGLTPISEIIHRVWFSRVAKNGQIYSIKYKQFLIFLYTCIMKQSLKDLQILIISRIYI